MEKKFQSFGPQETSEAAQLTFDVPVSDIIRVFDIMQFHANFVTGKICR